MYEGKRCFIIGGSPSIEKIPKAVWPKLESEVTLGVNRAYTLLRPTMTIVGDRWYYQHFHSELEKLDHPVILSSSILNVKMFPHYIIVQREDNSPKELSGSINSSVSFKTNTGLAACRIAYLLGCNPIYLIGIDCQKINNRSNWHNEYVKRDRTTTDERYELFHKTWIELIELLQLVGKEVISCSPVSKLNDEIPYENIENILNGHH